MTGGGTVRVTLPSHDQILITGEYDAPRHLVYKAWTTPELVRRWWSEKRGEMTTAEIHLRALTTVTFTEAAGTTTLAILIRYDSGQDRDAHSIYMKDGLQEALDLLGRTAKELTWEP